MSFLKQQLVVDPQSIGRRRIRLSYIDALNELLSGFSEMEEKDFDNDFVIKNKEGDIYCFDNFRYLFPKKVGEGSPLRAICCNGTDGDTAFRCVNIVGESIIVKIYDPDYKKALIIKYSITEEAKKYIEGKYKGKIGYYLLQLAGSPLPLLEEFYQLHLESKITINSENGNLVCYDETGKALSVTPTLDCETSYTNMKNKTGISFYSEIERKVDYMALLQKSYSASDDDESLEEEFTI